MSGNHLSPYKLIATVLTIKLCLLLLPCDFILTGSLYLLIPFTDFIQPSPPFPLVMTGFFSVSMTLFLFYFLDSTYNWNNKVIVFLCLTYFTDHTF